MTEDIISDQIDETISKIIDVLNSSNYDANIDASALINLLVNCAMDNKHTKEEWLSDMSRAWDHYEKERKNDRQTNLERVQ